MATRIAVVGCRLNFSRNPLRITRVTGTRRLYIKGINIRFTREPIYGINGPDGELGGGGVVFTAT